MFKTLFGGKPSGASSALPAKGASVEVVVAGRMAQTVHVDTPGPRSFITDGILGKSGESAVVIFTTTAGKFRFATRINGAKGNTTMFDMPRRIDRVGAKMAEHRRATVRLDAIVPGRWRFAPSGKGMGEFQKANIRDISRGGCSLIADRELRSGTLVEIQIVLKNGQAEITFLGEVVRSQGIPTSGRYSHGIRFHGVSAQEDRAIIDFINRKQTELRSRGLA